MATFHLLISLTGTQPQISTLNFHRAILSQNAIPPNCITRSLGRETYFRTKFFKLKNYENDIKKKDYFDLP